MAPTTFFNGPCSNRELDLVFAIDGSTAGVEAFALQRDFVAKVLSLADLDSGVVRAAILTFDRGQAVSFDFNQFAAQAGDLPAILDSVEQSLSIDTATQFVSTGRVFSAVARRVLDPAAGHRGGGVALFVLQTQPTVESDTNFFDRRDLLVRTPGVEIYPVAVASAIANVPSTTALSDMALLRHGGTPGTTVLSSETAIAVAADAARHILCDGFYTATPTTTTTTTTTSGEPSDADDGE